MTSTSIGSIGHHFLAAIVCSSTNVHPTRSFIVLDLCNFRSHLEKRVPASSETFAASRKIVVPVQTVDASSHKTRGLDGQ